MNHPTSQRSPVSCVRLSPSHHILYCTACVIYSLHRPALLRNQPCLDNFNCTSQPRFTLTVFTSVSNPHPILIMGQGAWKGLSVCLFPFLFGFHGLASWLHRKQNRKKDEMCFSSVPFRENPGRSRQWAPHRSHKGVEASVRHVRTRYGVPIL